MATLATASKQQQVHSYKLIKTYDTLLFPKLDSKKDQKKKNQTKNNSKCLFISVISFTAALIVSLRIRNRRLNRLLQVKVKVRPVEALDGHQAAAAGM